MRWTSCERLMRLYFVLVGIQLQNCAASCVEDVVLGRCVLLACPDQPKVDDLPSALEVFRFDAARTKNETLYGTWSQIYLACNHPAPKDVLDDFERNSRVLEQWRKDQRAKRSERMMKTTA
jgi:hypothetical protein